MKLNRYVVILLSLLLFTGVSAAATNKEHKQINHKQHSSKMSVANVNINTADAQQLSTLKSVGAKKAQAIVAYRKQHGKFTSVNDLTKVKGISQRIVTLNRSRLLLNGK